MGIFWLFGLWRKLQVAVTNPYQTSGRAGPSGGVANEYPAQPRSIEEHWPFVCLAPI
jgi:hypothetical protein